MLADPESGELKVRYAFAYDINDPEHSWKSIFEYKVKDDQICIGHIAGEAKRHTIFEWNGKEFRNALIEPAVKIEEKYEWNEFYRMIANANLEGIRGSTLEELKVDEYTRVFELTGFKPSFRDAYEDAFLQFSPHAKGVLPTEVSKEFLIEKLAGKFGLSKDLSISVDITGSNRGEYIFDMMGKDDGKFIFVGEAESRWADEGMDWSIFDKRVKKIFRHIMKKQGVKDQPFRNMAMVS